MKNKRQAHGKLIEKFQEKSQQAEVVRHDLKDGFDVSSALLCQMFQLTSNKISSHADSVANIQWKWNQFNIFQSGIGTQEEHWRIVRQEEEK